ncbi:NADP-dependent 3-hydroxy acid dehydrogenase YdfG [Marininema mesophilum]|uniref:NADP-dependent 3-hydroxy acid dehydrogenase YdfG n=1 Tax=Marininema mesophilum TaxID=1048340 RepID=A0A1H2UMY8_9BACL|nr:SDR family oxidoreductase [Marininema mesophilum]SDW56894.1 NADP-dependent 3-hydroxy acid dehydrogenase YdfG [Marininema mesophilum]
MADLYGKVAIVTGASKGLGAAITRRFVKSGAQVVAAARSRDKLEILHRDYPDQILPIPCDVTNPDQVQDLINHTARELGRIDILVNNAGLGRFAPVKDLTVEDWDQMMNVNLKGTFLACKYAIPHLIKSKGHIVNISSVAGSVTFPGGGGYCASKFGLMALSDILTQELKKDEVRVNTLSPGSVQTEFSANPKDYALTAEQVAETTWMMVTAPKGVIYSNITMRPQVPPELQK